MFKLFTFPLRMAAKAVTLPVKVATLPLKAVTYPLRSSKKKQKYEDGELEALFSLQNLWINTTRTGGTSWQYCLCPQLSVR